ncbi:beta-lactamase regulating signal transducer with metallopeptidase domain [Paenibacillus turicensis]|uniref:Beta-lactamase regulating signal transducer with metallopeptidase domain n=1 Tax=Paenibacillus turicensis TaxID=160487 RepID=A0ABS4FN59_9BACL|nr:M56 family metallopeptidase [Paenibacillus turicensis]MBP1904013.1 beta-lactamase regulating signal transducer with metallopeptidase domain [Paenibacillus turicensis]
MNMIWVFLWKNSILASVIILVIIVLRIKLLRKCPRIITLVLWGTLGFKLIIPAQIPINLIISPQFMETQNEFSTTNNFITLLTPLNANLPHLENTGSLQNVLLPTYLSIIWFIVVVILLTLYISLHLYNHHRFKTACIIKNDSQLIAWQKYFDIPLHVPIYQSNRTQTPIVHGIMKQKIILPTNLLNKSTPTTRNVLLHEYTHLRHRDNLLLCIATLITILYWFNPLVWLSLTLFMQDIEYRCDEKVVKQIGIQQRKEYALSLLEMVTPLKSNYFTLNSTFKSKHFKVRVKRIMNYAEFKSKSIILGIITIIVVVLLTTFSLVAKAEPPSAEPDYLSRAHVESFILNNNAYKQSEIADSYSNSDYSVTTFVDPFTISVEIVQEKITASNPEVNLSPDDEKQLNQIQNMILSVIKQTVSHSKPDEDINSVSQDILVGLQQQFKLANTNGFKVYITK